MTNIANLPFEIIDHINYYMTHADRVQLIRVNLTFHRLFILLLYRTIRITVYQQFLQLTTIFEQQPRLGHCVHQLDLLLDKLEVKELQQIQHQCPYIQSIHVDWRIWKYLGQSEQQPYATELFTFYGNRQLSSLTLDLYNTQLDSRAILCHTPHLKSLTLMGIQTTISISFIESLHDYCPILQDISMEGTRADAYLDLPLREYALQSTTRLRSFKIKTPFGADRYQDWLPWVGKKYPLLQSFDFHHAGSGKDIIEPCSLDIYQQFLLDCPQLSSVGWHNSAPDFRFFQQLEKSKQRLTQVEIYDSIAVPSLLTSALFDTHDILQSVTRLVFGPAPRGMATHALIEAISKACPLLTQLELCAPHCDLANPYKIDSILNNCHKLVSLHLERIALRVSFKHSQASKHPLKKLILRHCSLFEGVFDHMSPRCPDLDHLVLLACTQRDRRYKVQIHLPFQRFKRIELHALRTETYDVDRRMRFFSVSSKWYFMSSFDTLHQVTCRDPEQVTGMEIASGLTKLGTEEAQLLHELLQKPIAWSQVEERKQAYLSKHHSDMVKQWQPQDIYDAGYVELVCRSIDHLYINNKRI